jgi:hypothetical protein
MRFVMAVAAWLLLLLIKPLLGYYLKQQAHK